MTPNSNESWLKTEEQKKAYDSIPKEIHERVEKMMKVVFKKPSKELV